MQPTNAFPQIVPAETEHHFTSSRKKHFSLRDEMKLHTHLLCPPKHSWKGKQKSQADDREEMEGPENPTQEMSVGEAAQDPQLAALMGKMEGLSVEATEGGEED